MTNEKIDLKKFMDDLDTEEFWLKIRRFASSSSGFPRAQSKQAVLLYVASVLSEAQEK